jgi:hypothetical protein
MPTDHAVAALPFVTYGGIPRGARLIRERKNLAHRGGTPSGSDWQQARGWSSTAATQLGLVI